MRLQRPHGGLLPTLLAALLLVVACGGERPHLPPPAPAPSLPTYEPGPADGPASTDPAWTPAPAAPAAENDLGGLLGEPEGPRLVLHFIDVGQGDGALVQTPGGKAILIDTGPPPARNRVLKYLEDLQVHHIDLLVNSHAHADHIGGAATIIGEITIGQVLDSGLAHLTPPYEEMLAALEKDQVPVKIARRGRHVTLEEGITLEVLAPEDPLIAGSRSDHNANSIVLRLVYGDVRVLFSGDAEHETEERLLRSAPGQLAAEVLKIAHHGSRYASEAGFLRAVRPRLAVVSYGRNNRYGHPAPETMERLQRMRIPVLETGRHGNVILVTDGKRLQVVTVPRPGGPYGGAKVWRPGQEPAIANDVKKVDVNHAGIDELSKLPGIGKSVAQRIIDWRRHKGRFQKVEDLRRVKGIGARLIERLRPQVEFGPGVSR